MHRIMFTKGTTFVIEGTCPVTGKDWKLEDVPVEGYFAWQHGQHIQNALPTLTDSERELLISGTTQEGWDQLFAGMEED